MCYIISTNMFYVNSSYGIYILVLIEKFDRVRCFRFDAQCAQGGGGGGAGAWEGAPPPKGKGKKK